MPNFDGTGPTGQGAMTGRRRGRCRDSKNDVSEKNAEQSNKNEEVIYGLGRGGRPRGGGFGNRFGGGKGSGRGRGRGFGGR